MFIGHYAVSFALKSTNHNVSLGALFIAVQFVDILFFPLTLAGIEQFRIVENFTQATHFELLDMPYSHSMVATVIWGMIAFALVWKFSIGRRIASAAVIAIAVMSHWALDLIVHTPDLPLHLDPESTKLGFGLWRNAVATYLFEALLLLGGFYLYQKSVEPQSKVKRYGMYLFIAALLGINLLNIFGDLPANVTEISVAVSSLLAYVVIAVIAQLLETGKSQKTLAQEA